MEHALVVFESMYGNTESIAEAIAAGLAERMSVTVVEVGSAPALLEPDLDLLVVGGPTHQFGLSRPSSRASAARESESVVLSPTIGLREWLEKVEHEHPGFVATFDTKLAWPRLPGSAARGAMKRLLKRGFQAISPPKTFWVEGTKGPLMESEWDRATAWGRWMSIMVTTHAMPHASRY